MFILDSSAIIDVIHGNERGAKVMAIVGDEKFYITSLSVNEILFSENETGKTLEFVEKSYVFNFDKEAAKVSVQIEKDLKKNRQDNKQNGHFNRIHMHADKFYPHSVRQRFQKNRRIETQNYRLKLQVRLER